MNRFSIAQDVTKRLPKMQVVIVVAQNLNNEAENPAVTEFAQVRRPLPKHQQKLSPKPT